MVQIPDTVSWYDTACRLSHAFPRSSIQPVCLFVCKSSGDDPAIHTVSCVMAIHCATDCITVNLCFLSTDNAAQWHLETYACFPRVSHITRMRRSVFLSLLTSSTHLCCVYSTGEGTHSPQSGYVQPSPMTAPHRSSDLSTFPHILDTHKPLSTFLCHLSRDVQQVLLVWMEPDETWPVLMGGKKCHFNLGSLNCCKLSYGSILGPF